MKRILTLAMLAGAVLMFTPQAVRADMANGSYTNDLGASVPLWDVSGSYTNAVDLFTFDYTVSQAASGKLTGGGTFTVVGLFDNVEFNVTNGVCSAIGKVTGSSTAPKVSLTFSGSGSGTAEYLGIALNVTKFKITSTFNGEINEADREAIGNITATASATFLDPATGKSKSRSKTEVYKDVVIALPASATGTNWNLTMNLTPDGTKKYNTGVATVLTSDGNTATFTTTGTYASKTDTSAIHLTGTGASKGCSLSLGISTSGTNLTVNTLSGTLFGQTVKFKAP